MVSLERVRAASGIRSHGAEAERGAVRLTTKLRNSNQEDQASTLVEECASYGNRPFSSEEREVMTISEGGEAPRKGYDENGILIGEEQGSYDGHRYVQAGTDYKYN